MRRFVTISTSIVSLFALGAGMASASSFSDVYSTDEHYAAIEWLSEQGVVEGYEVKKSIQSRRPAPSI